MNSILFVELMFLAIVLFAGYKLLMHFRWTKKRMYEAKTEKESQSDKAKLIKDVSTKLVQVWEEKPELFYEAGSASVWKLPHQKEANAPVRRH